MGILRCVYSKFLPTFFRRNTQLCLCLVLGVYIVLSTFTRQVLQEDNQPVEYNDESSVTLKPGLLELINATEINFPSTLNAEYILQNKGLCSSTASVTFVVMVYTAPTHFDRRKLMRETWLNQTILSAVGSAKYVFLLGQVNTTSLQSEIEQEFKQYGDIVQGNFMDTYANLTLKGVMGLKWLSENCQNAKLLIKSDDDMVINIYRFFNEIVPEMLTRKEQVFCWRSPRSIIFRGVKHKSYLPKNYFHGMHSYPLYCKGPFVFMTFDIVPLLLKSVAITPFIWLEDVYLYGVVMQNIPSIKYAQFIRGVDFDLEISSVMKCFNNTYVRCEMFAAGVSGADDMMPVWTSMLKLNKQAGVNL